MMCECIYGFVVLALEIFVESCIIFKYFKILAAHSNKNGAPF